MPSPVPVILTNEHGDIKFPNMKMAEAYLGIFNNGAMLRHYLKTGQRLRGYKISKQN